MEAESNDNQIVWIDKNIWCTKEHLLQWTKHTDKLYKDVEYRILFGIERKEKLFDRFKWAWIKVANTRKMCWVDNKTMRAYKADGYKKTYIEIKKFTFERWCTSFDL